MNWVLSLKILLCFTTFAVAAEPFVERGDEAEAYYRKYTARLAKNYERLKTALTQEAPDLIKKLSPEPPKPIVTGYQIVPKIIKDPESAKVEHITGNSYSWPITMNLIDFQNKLLEEMEEKLQSVPKLEPTQRHPVLEQMVKDYPTLESDQRTIDSHVRYNRFWQKEIANDPRRFDRLTVMHDLAVERQRLLDELQAKPGDKQLSAKEQEIAHQIQVETYGKIDIPSFLKVERKKNKYTLIVPIYTDIDDAKFLQGFEKAVEHIWRWESEYRVDVVLKKIKLVPSPKQGEEIDLYAYAERFPKDGAVLLTGAKATFAQIKRFVALGPQEIAETVLAHEFGHILGFTDGYFRGYRNLGRQGFQVLEIVPDPTDIMCTPGAGKVQKFHFDSLIPLILKTKASPQASPPKS